MPDIALERRALALFEAMLDVAEDDRTDWLERQTSGDRSLHDRVGQLVRADTLVSMRTSGAFFDLGDVDPPERIGNYRIVGLIGSGGMGSVFAAVRDSGDFDHDVAIKIIKPGILPDSLVQRFERERQVLAGLNHPHIARLLDGGTAQNGLPYFVMERVEGVALRDWLDTEPSLTARLRLFKQVCDAAGYAHQNLIVHRDLTPANVLVEHGGNAKLIDFGIARPDGEETGAAGLPLRALTLTPGYAAPERLAGKAATVTSDIFSAGKLLAWLVETPRPAELQAIIDKAIAAEPDQRYRAMGELASDIDRFQSARTVNAVPYSRYYAFRKWFQRNRVPAVLGMLLLVALVGGLGATAWYAQAERAARAEADKRFNDVRSLATFMLFDLYDDLAPLSGNTKSLARIADEARKYLERLSVGDDLSPQLRLEIAQGYHRLSTVTGNPEGPNLGRRDDARMFLDRALHDLESLHREYPREVRFAAALADALYSDAILRFIGEDDNPGGAASAAKSAELYDEAAQREPTDPDFRLKAIRSRLQAAKPLVWMDKGGQGVTKLYAAQAELAEWRKTRPDNREAERLAAAIASEIGYTRSWHYDIGSAGFMAGLASLDDAVTGYEKLIASAPDEDVDDFEMSLLPALFNRSLIYSDLERWTEALRDLDRAEAIAQAAIARDPEDVGTIRRREAIWSQKAYALMGLGRPGEAVSRAGKLVEARRSRAAEAPGNIGHARDLANAIQILGDAQMEAGSERLACHTHAEALQSWRAINARTPLSRIDRENSVKPLEELIRSCT